MTPGAHQHIVTAAASGDDEALTLLIRAYHDRIYRFGQRVCRDSFDADDAVQQAFVALARRPDVARHRGALSWLMTSVRNACLRMLRPFLRERSSLGERGGTEEAVSPQLDPQQLLERWELAQSVHAAIAALPRPYREVVVMRDLEGLSGEENDAHDVSSCLRMKAAEPAPRCRISLGKLRATEKRAEKTARLRDSADSVEHQRLIGAFVRGESLSEDRYAASSK